MKRKQHRDLKNLLCTCLFYFNKQNRDPNLYKLRITTIFMVKEEVKKKPSKIEVEQALIDNFINLQRVLTNLSLKFDDLSTNMSKMLQLFEISAKTFAEKYSTEEPKTGDVDTELLKKLDSLLDQNKTISKGIMLMEEKIRDRNTPGVPPQFAQKPMDENRMQQMQQNPQNLRRPLPRY